MALLPVFRPSKSLTMLAAAVYCSAYRPPPAALLSAAAAAAARRISPALPFAVHLRRRGLEHYGGVLAPRRRGSPPAVAMSLVESPIVHDVCTTAMTSGVALGLLRFWEEVAKMGVFDQKLNRKLVHISIGLAFMLFWPLYSSGVQAPFLAALAPGVNSIRMLLMGLGIWRNEALVKSMSRNGDYGELLKGPLYYACTITLATTIFWRTSPIAIAAICNLCAGDGFADIIGRRFGDQKLPYNLNKSFAGTIAMAVAGFVASIGYMYYYSFFGFMEESWNLIVGFLVVSIATAFVESLPISSKMDDNLTVPLTSLVVGFLVL